MNLFIENALRFSGVNAWFYVGAKRTVTIVNYHDPAPDVFAAHLRLLARRYRFISIDALTEALQNRDFSALPEYPLAITFDDGHAGNIRLLPSLQEYRVPAVIYAASGLIGTRRHFWWKELQNQGLGRWIPEMKKLPLDDFKRRLKELCDYEFEREYDVPDALSVDELRRLRDAGCSIGAHSVNHPILTNCSEKEIEFECRESKRALEETLQESVRHFALPNGDYNDQIIAQLEALGYLTNRTIDSGRNTEETSPFRLKNFGLSDVGSVANAALKVAGCWDALKRRVC